MPNAIKYSTTIPTGSLLKGTVALGVTTASISGPTSTTGWYYGPNPVAGKYQIIETAASGDPDVYCPQSDAELIQFVKTKGATGANTASLSASLAWIGTQTNLMAANFEYENIVTSGLVLNVDAGFVGSYPTTASTWYDISGNAKNGTLTNGPTFNSANSGSIVFDGVDDYCTFGTTPSNFNPSSITYDIWFKENGVNNGTFLLCGSGGVGGAGQFGVYFQTGTIFFSTNSSNQYYASWSTTANFRNIVFSWNGTTALFYSNGISISLTGPSALGVNAFGTFNISSRNGTDYRFRGNVSTTKIYNRGLSADEILQNYNATKGRFGL